MITLINSSNTKIKVNKEKAFYIFNHLCVLGLADGPNRIAEKVNMDEPEILNVFHQIHKKNRPNHLG